jgi:hypothetical protein
MRKGAKNNTRQSKSFLLLLIVVLVAVFTTSCLPSQEEEKPVDTATPSQSVISTATQVSTAAATPMLTSIPIPSTEPTRIPDTSHSRGYLTTPQELHIIKKKADQGIEPYKDAVDEVLSWAKKSWEYKLDANERCRNADDPKWNDNGNGTPILFAKALAFHLTGEIRYAQEVKTILQRIMTEVKTISVEEQTCRLNFSWGTPELVASADLIEDFWKNQTCTGPTSLLYNDTAIDSGPCKVLFQNWLVKNPYYVISYTASAATSNWGAAATNATAYIADYLWDRPDVLLLHRNPEQVNSGKDIALNPAQAYAYANKLAIDRMNGYRVENSSNSSCDYLSGPQQNSNWGAVKSQITEKGIIPEDARRQEYCNIPKYNGSYENYPQLHLGNNIQQCELMLRRGDSSCYDNVDNRDIPRYSFVDPTGIRRTTHLYPGRGSIERGINAIIIDSNTEWRHISALAVAYHYYYNHAKLPGIQRWPDQRGIATECSQDICFGTLTHGFAPGETPGLPPIVSPP